MTTLLQDDLLLHLTRSHHGATALAWASHADTDSIHTDIKLVRFCLLGRPGSTGHTSTHKKPAAEHSWLTIRWQPTVPSLPSQWVRLLLMTTAWSSCSASAESTSGHDKVDIDLHDGVRRPAAPSGFSRCECVTKALNQQLNHVSRTQSFMPRAVDARASAERQRMQRRHVVKPARGSHASQCVVHM